MISFLFWSAFIYTFCGTITVLTHMRQDRELYIGGEDGELLAIMCVFSVIWPLMIPDVFPPIAQWIGGKIGATYNRVAEYLMIPIHMFILED